MGRKKKYNVDELKEAQKKWAREYYHRNKEALNKRTMEKYYEKTRNHLQND
jgi:hypothetical protein